jgi:C1A family cysteine protease
MKTGKRSVAFFGGTIILIASLISTAFPSELPAKFDWRDNGIVTPVKDQKYFGACGVFAGVALFEALIKKETGLTVDLSEQHVINGSPDWRSSGMSAPSALKFMRDHGIVLEKHLPYKAGRTDEKPDHPFDYILTDYHTQETHGLPLKEKIRRFKKAIHEFGPVATNMTVYKDYDSYRSGIYVYDGISEEIGGHWVLVVGWEDDPSVKNGGYWICKNSDLPSSDRGYINIAYGEAGIDDFWFAYGIYRPDSQD